MSKYAPLRDYLQKQSLSEIVLTFSNIEKIIANRLPKSAELPQWWANEKNGSHVQRDAWRKAGYDAFLIKGSSKVKFKQAKRSS